MKILMVSGGSGGHIYPCLELAKYFSNKGIGVVLAGKNKSLEETIFTKYFDFFGIKISGSKLTSYIKNRKIINTFYNQEKFDAVFLFGNYISLPFAIGAILNKIPIFLHEQNIIYGRANKLLGYKAKKIYLSLPIKKDIHKNKSLLVGNPKSESIYVKSNLDKKNYNVVIAMGSLGSVTINSFLENFIMSLRDNNICYHIVVGKNYYDKFINKIENRSNIKIYPYLENLSSYIKDCDIFISRAGATTISEIIYNEVVSILIPSPYVKDNHQYLNAKYLYDNQCAYIIEEKDLTSKLLEEKIHDLVNDKNKYFDIKMNLKKIKIVGSKEKIYEDMINELKR